MLQTKILVGFVKCDANQYWMFSHCNLSTVDIFHRDCMQKISEASKKCACKKGNGFSHHCACKITNGKYQISSTMQMGKSVRNGRMKEKGRKNSNIKWHMRRSSRFLLESATFVPFFVFAANGRRRLSKKWKYQMQQDHRMFAGIEFVCGSYVSTVKPLHIFTLQSECECSLPIFMSSKTGSSWTEAYNKGNPSSEPFEEQSARDLCYAWNPFLIE